MKRNADTGLFTKPSTLTVHGENTMSEREFVVVGGSQGIGLAITRLFISVESACNGNFPINARHQ
jgi:hypothetical protein